MNWLVRGLLVCSWLAACATTDPIDATDDTGRPDAAADVAPTPQPDAQADVKVTPKPDASTPETSFAASPPVISAMTPTKATAGGVGLTLTITGDEFVSWSVVRADGTDLATTFVNETTLRAQVPASRIDSAGVLQIDVFTAPPGGGKSTNIGFLVENPAPVLTSIAPSSVQVGSGDIILTLNGTNFAKNPKVSFDGVDLVMVSNTATMLTATVPSQLMANAGSHNVRVTNPAPGGGQSANIAFIVTNPQAVSVTSINPTWATLGSGDLSLSIDGAGFASASVVSFNGINIPSNTTDPAHISATIPAALFGTAGSFPIVVTNPPPGGGVSSPLQFEVRNPVPVITTVSPNTVYKSVADRKVSVLGTGFVPTTAVLVDGVPVTTTFLSQNELEAVIPAAKLASLGTLTIKTRTPGPGGGDSPSALTLYVICDAAGVDLALGAVGSMSTLFTEFATAPPMVSLNSSACPGNFATSLPPQPHRMWVVQNNQPTPVTLSAYAVCSVGSVSEDDGLLTFYRRGTPPTTNAERLACEGRVSEGASGQAGNYSSPEANGSTWCPGLTKANGGGIELASCERAVVSIAPYSYTSTVFTPPVAVRIKAE